jgi:hypothetical protein
MIWNDARGSLRREPFIRIGLTIGFVPYATLGWLAALGGTFNNEPKINGYDQLDAAVEYILKYEGTNPSEAIKNTYEIVDTVKGLNPKEEHIVELETKLTSTEKQLAGTTNPLIYEPILKQAVTEISQYQSRHSRTNGDILGLVGMSAFYIPLTSILAASYFPTAEEREARNGNAYQARRRQRYDNDIHPDQDDPFRNHDR